MPSPLYAAPASSAPSLDVAVIRFDPVVVVLSAALSARSGQPALVLQVSYGGRVATQTIPYKHMRRLIVCVLQSLLQKHLRSFPIPRFGKIKVDCLAAAVDGTEQVQPLSGNTHKCLVHMPG
jgi:hypothetical protein